MAFNPLKSLLTTSVASLTKKQRKITSDIVIALEVEANAAAQYDAATVAHFSDETVSKSDLDAAKKRLTDARDVVTGLHKAQAALADTIRKQQTADDLIKVEHEIAEVAVLCDKHDNVLDQIGEDIKTFTARYIEALTLAKEINRLAPDMPNYALFGPNHLKTAIGEEMFRASVLLVEYISHDTGTTPVNWQSLCLAGAHSNDALKSPSDIEPIGQRARMLHAGGLSAIKHARGGKPLPVGEPPARQAPVAPKAEPEVQPSGHTQTLAQATAGMSRKHVTNIDYSGKGRL